jgi:hypothetical protein
MEEYTFGDPKNKNTVHRGRLEMGGWMLSHAPDQRLQEFRKLGESPGDGRQNCRLLQDLRELGVDTE